MKRIAVLTSDGDCSGMNAAVRAIVRAGLAANIVAEGAGNAQKIGEQIKDKIGFETRTIVLGHYQRGGSPTVFDRLLATRFGQAAVKSLLAGKKGEMLGLINSTMQLTPLEDVIAAGIRPIDELLPRLISNLTI